MIMNECFGSKRDSPFLTQFVNVWCSEREGGAAVVRPDCSIFHIHWKGNGLIFYVGKQSWLKRDCMWIWECAVIRRMLSWTNAMFILTDVKVIMKTCEALVPLPYPLRKPVKALALAPDTLVSRKRRSWSIDFRSWLGGNAHELVLSTHDRVQSSRPAT